MEKTQGISYSHAGQPIEPTGAALCPNAATDYAQFCSSKDKQGENRISLNVATPESSQLKDTCGGDGGCPFVRCRQFAACSSHRHTRITNAESRIPSLVSSVGIGF